MPKDSVHESLLSNDRRNRFLVESFVYQQPWWMLHLGLVPYWATFNDRRSVNQLHDYLDSDETLRRDLHESVLKRHSRLGQATIEEWQSTLARARKRGQFMGVNEQTYPGDLASFIRHYSELKKLNGRYSMPESLTLHQLDTFLEQMGDRYSVRWME